MQYAISNKVPYTAIDGLLKLLQVLCPKPNLLPKSFYKVKMFFKQFNTNTILKKVCCKSSSIVEDGLNVCDKCGILQGNVGQLAHIPISKALQTIVSSKL